MFRKLEDKLLQGLRLVEKSGVSKVLIEEEMKRLRNLERLEVQMFVLMWGSPFCEDYYTTTTRPVTPRGHKHEAR